MNIYETKKRGKSYNNYPPHTHTSGGGGGLLDLPCTQGQLLMDAKLFNGTTKCRKLLLPPKITYLYYIKLHGVQGNPSGIVAWSFASMPKIVTCVPHLFHVFFSSPNSRKTTCQLLSKCSLNRKEKLAGKIYPSPIM